MTPGTIIKSKLDHTESAREYRKEAFRLIAAAFNYALFMSKRWRKTGTLIALCMLRMQYDYTVLYLH